MGEVQRVALAGVRLIQSFDPLNPKTRSRKAVSDARSVAHRNIPWILTIK